MQQRQRCQPLNVSAMITVTASFLCIVAAEPALSKRSNGDKSSRWLTTAPDTSNKIMDGGGYHGAVQDFTPRPVADKFVCPM